MQGFTPLFLLADLICMGDYTKNCPAYKTFNILY